MINSIKRFWLSNFRVISTKRAKELNLKFFRNLHGDEINRFNCRSIWKDEQGRLFRVRELFDKLIPEKSNQRLAKCSICFNTDYVIDVTVDEVNVGPMCKSCCKKKGFCFSCGDYSAGDFLFEYCNREEGCGPCQIEEINDRFDS